MFFAGEKEYYERQWATLKSFEEVDSLMTSNYIDEEDLVEQAEQAEQAQQEMAMRISNYANVVLLAFKVINHRSIQVQSSLIEILCWWCIFHAKCNMGFVLSFRLIAIICVRNEFFSQKGRKLSDNLQCIFPSNHVLFKSTKQTHLWGLCQKIEVKKLHIQQFRATILYDHLI